MAKVKSKGKGRLVPAVRSAVGLDISSEDRDRLIQACRRDIKADRHLIAVGMKMPSTLPSVLLGTAISATGNVRLEYDRKSLARLQASKA